MKYFTTLGLFFLILFMINTPTFSEIDLIADGAIIINAETGQILYSKNEHTPLFPASTTKILTAIIILEDMNLLDTIVVDPESPYAGGSHIALEPGEEVTVEQLLYSLLIASANDAAEVLARKHSGSIEAFSEVMNARAAEMGALSSNFANPHGLHNKDHISTAYDLAIIAQYAMKNNTFRTIIKTKRYEIPPTNRKTETRYLNSTNSLYQGIAGSTQIIDVNGERVPIAYEFADGIKRGYTPEAQFCFVGSATKDGRQFITAVLKSQSTAMYEDTRKMMDYAFSGTTKHLIAKSGDPAKTLTLSNKKQTSVTSIYAESVSIDLPNDYKLEDIESRELISSHIELPLKKGEFMGTKEFYLNDALLHQVTLVSDDNYIGEDLLNDITQFFSTEKRSWSVVLVKILLAILLWRTIMTMYRINKLKRRQHQKKTRLG
ncbi:MAG: D-alanyl-D-alanine carboxypeptidase [Clostridia bacterium]|nr:D-alanyl-D-alanine carboxypeptidase [Clostridia bacterium]